MEFAEAHYSHLECNSFTRFGPVLASTAPLTPCHVSEITQWKENPRHKTVKQRNPEPVFTKVFLCVASQLYLRLHLKKASLLPSSHRMRSTSQHTQANYGTHCGGRWECSHSLQATSKGLHANLCAHMCLRVPCEQALTPENIQNSHSWVLGSDSPQQTMECWDRQTCDFRSACTVDGRQKFRGGHPTHALTPWKPRWMYIVEQRKKGLSFHLCLARRKKQDEHDSFSSSFLWHQVILYMWGPSSLMSRLLCVLSFIVVRCHAAERSGVLVTKCQQWKGSVCRWMRSECSKCFF